MAYYGLQGMSPYGTPVFSDLPYSASYGGYMPFGPSGSGSQAQMTQGAPISSGPQNYGELPDWARSYYGASMQGQDMGNLPYLQRRAYQDYQALAAANPSLVDPITGVYTPWAIQQGLGVDALKGSIAMPGASQYSPETIAGYGFDWSNATQNPGSVYTQQYYSPWSGAQQFSLGGFSGNSPSLYNNNGQWVDMAYAGPGNSTTTTIGSGAATTAYGYAGNNALNRRM